MSNPESTTTDIPEQNFRRESGPDESCMAGDDALFELTNYYKGDVTPSGRTPHVEITYYVRYFPAAETNQDDDFDRWSVDCMFHSWLTSPDDPYGPDNPSEDEYDYEGGSDLWYMSEERALHACRENFAKYDEAWKLNGWTPA